ncbi:MAG: VWA domain-containing protein [Vicinamibacterales bacterium]
MRRRRLMVTVLAALVLLMSPAGTTTTRAADPLRVVLIVDSSTNMSSMLTEFRSGLHAFIDNLPDDVELALISTGGQIRIRLAPTSDKAKMEQAVSRFASDGGANSLLDTLLESDRRFLKPAADRRPLFVLLTTDQPMLGEPPLYAYNNFVKDFVRRRGRAHGIVIRGTNTGLISQIVENLTGNTDGIYHTLVVGNSLADHMKQVADEVAAQQ